MKKKWLLSVLVVFLALVIAGCGQSKAEASLNAAQAKNEALLAAMRMYKNICDAANGDQAKSLFDEFEETLTKVQMLVVEQYLDPAPCVSRAYESQARAAFKALLATHSDEVGARKLAEEYRHCIQAMGRNIKPIREKEVALAIARNEREMAVATERAHGGVKPPIPKKRRVAKRASTRSSRG